MERNCDVRGKMCEFWWLLRIEKNRKNARTTVARGARMNLIAKNAPKVMIPWMTFVSTRMGMLRHYVRMSNALEVPLGEATGEPT